MAEQNSEETVQEPATSEELDFDLMTLNHELVAVNRC
jgi:hypothetical protein